MRLTNSLSRAYVIDSVICSSALSADCLENEKTTWDERATGTISDPPTRPETRHQAETAAMLAD